MAEASAQTDRLRDWVCGDYTIQGPCGPEKLRVDASIGLAEHIPNETLKALLARADGQMYERKAASRAHEQTVNQRPTIEFACLALYVVIHLKFVGMRTQTQCIDFLLPLVGDIGLQQISVNTSPFIRNW